MSRSLPDQEKIVLDKIIKDFKNIGKYFEGKSGVDFAIKMVSCLLDTNSKSEDFYESQHRISNVAVGMQKYAATTPTREFSDVSAALLTLQSYMKEDQQSARSIYVKEFLLGFLAELTIAEAQLKQESDRKNIRKNDIKSSLSPLSVTFGSDRTSEPSRLSSSRTLSPPSSSPPSSTESQTRTLSPSPDSSLLESPEFVSRTISPQTSDSVPSSAPSAPRARRIPGPSSRATTSVAKGE